MDAQACDLLATVMPHALFLGSSLASIDRLNILPTPPTQNSPRQNAPRSYVKTLSHDLLSRLRRRPNFRRIEKARRRDDGDIELRDCPPDSYRKVIEVAASSSADTDFSRSENEVEEKPMMSEVEDDKEKLSYQALRKQYEADVKSFDRIAWVDVHLLHSTVRLYALFGNN